MSLLVFVISIIVLLAIGVPVFVALALSGLLLGQIGTGQFVSHVCAQKMFAGVDSSVILAIPLFMVTGEIMNRGGLANRLVDLASVLVGRFRGGLSYVTILTCAFLAAILGSSSACAAMVGAILIPAMLKKGYDRTFSAGLVASAGGLGPIIPPSTTAIVYAVAAEQSVKKLFVAGYVPGVICGLCFCIYSYIIACRKRYPAEPAPTLQQFALAFRRGIIPLMLPIIIMGGIMSGLFTASESGACAVVYCLFISLVVYREVKISELPEILLSAAKNSTVVLSVMMSASFLSYMMTITRIPQTAATMVTSITTNRILVLLLINILLILTGMFLDGASAVLILTPVLLPVCRSLGIDLIYFGVMMTINLMIGVVTPPVGMNLYITARQSELDMLSVARAAFPFMLIFLGFIIISMFFPELITFLPSITG